MIEEERRTVGLQSWATLRALAANQSGRKENVKALCDLWCNKFLLLIFDIPIVG